ncbi:hypothetical protein MMC18_003782 [Xylographa bjoerkii]|nr:hypothetical protein [Xylographa bjoerkii]
MVVCRFFARGSCARGDTCTYEHISDPDSDDIEAIPCQYYARGYWRNGRWCQFEVTSNMKRADDIESCTREIGDAVVTFGAGAAVETIKTSSSTLRYIKKYSVVCSWYKPTQSAILTFSSERHACEAMESLCSKHGWPRHKLQCRLKSPDGVHDTYCVEVGNRPFFVAADFLLKLLKGKPQPLDIKLRDCSYASSGRDIASEIRKLLDSIAALISWNANTAIGHARAKAIAEFANIEEVGRAVDGLHGTIVPLSKGSKLYVNQCISVHFRIFTEMYNAIQLELNQLVPHFSTDKHVSFKAFPLVGMTNRFTILRASGEDVRAVARAKVAIQRLLLGKTATKDSMTIWNDFFHQPQGLTYLENAGRPHDVFVYRDSRRSRPLLHGPADAIDLVQQKLSTEVDKLHDATSTNIIRGSPPENSRQTENEQIQAGSSSDFSDARSLQEAFSSTIFREDENGSITPQGFSNEFVEECTCAVCFCEATDPYTMRCGHTYCRSCFANQCSSINQRDIPVRCLGEAATCGHVFTLVNLVEALGSKEFNALLDKSMESYVQMNPDKFQYCPTPDCSFIYAAASADEQVVCCPKCLILICTTCRAIDHEGLGCEKYQATRERDEQAFVEWKTRNNVKDCPKCASPIEKIEGCNHMTCAACGAHLCWYCMETFAEAALVYAHMEEKHGGHYEVDEEAVGMNL